MKRRKIIGIVLVCFLAAIGSFGIVMADTVLIPVIAVNQPNTTTIVSVFNNFSTFTSTHLKYIYRSKDAFTGTPATANHTGTCSTSSFTRPTFANDLVSFDAAGNLNSGNALFNDPNTYTGGSFNLSSGAKRAYLLVTHANSSGVRQDVSHNESIGAEAMIMDIGTGASYGVRGVNDNTQEDYDFTQAGVGTAIQGGTSNCKWFPFFPTDEWTTKFFTTPIGNNMDSADLAGFFTLINYAGGGLYTRGGTAHAFTVKTDVTCTAGVDLEDMMDSSALAAVQNIGGWAWICPTDNSSVPSTSPLVVYKLDFVVSNATYGGTNNNGLLMSINGANW